MISKEFLVLRALEESPQGLYGADFVSGSGGSIKRSSIYVVLSRMEEKGLIVSELIASAEPDALPRRRYRASKNGKRLFRNVLTQARLCLTAG
jgi:DNA-binding PadR family transcriptional regulator